MNWLSELDKLLGGDGTAFQKEGERESGGVGENSPPLPVSPSPPLHRGTRDLLITSPLPR